MAGSEKDEGHMEWGFQKASVLVTVQQRLPLVYSYRKLWVFGVCEPLIKGQPLATQV